MPFGGNHILSWTAAPHRRHEDFTKISQKLRKILLMTSRYWSEPGMQRPSLASQIVSCQWCKFKTFSFLGQFILREHPGVRYPAPGCSGSRVSCLNTFRVLSTPGSGTRTACPVPNRPSYRPGNLGAPGCGWFWLKMHFLLCVFCSLLWWQRSWTWRISIDAYTASCFSSPRLRAWLILIRYIL